MSADGHELVLVPFPFLGDLGARWCSMGGSNFSCAEKYLLKSQYFVDKDQSVALKGKTVQRYKGLLEQARSYVLSLESLVDEHDSVTKEKEQEEQKTTKIDIPKFIFDRYGIDNVLREMCSIDVSDPLRIDMCEIMSQWYRCRFVDYDIYGKNKKYTINQIPNTIASIVFMFHCYVNNNSLDEFKTRMDRWVIAVKCHGNPFIAPSCINSSNLREQRPDRELVATICADWNWFQFKFNQIAEELNIDTRLSYDIIENRMKSLDIRM